MRETLLYPEGRWRGVMLLCLLMALCGCQCDVEIPSSHLGTIGKTEDYADETIGADAKGGSDNGDARLSTFFFPFGLAYFNNTLYVADYGNHQVRKLLITPQGTQVQTVTGKGEKTGQYRNGHFDVALFYGPNALTLDYRTIDGKGEEPRFIYLTDSKNHLIRRLDLKSKQVETFAGGREPGLQDGPASKALFSNPSAIAAFPLDPTSVPSQDKRILMPKTGLPAPILFVADTDNHTIRVALKTDNPASCGVSDINDEGVCLYRIAGTGQCRPDPNRTRFSGAFLDCLNEPKKGDALNYQLHSPTGLAVANDGTVFLSDTRNHRILKMTYQAERTEEACQPQGCYQMEHIAGSWKTSDAKGIPYIPQKGYKEGCGSLAEFYFPKGLAVDCAGNVFVADFSNGYVRKLTPQTDGTYCTSVMKKEGVPIPIPQPVGIAIDQKNQRLYVTRAYGTDHKIYRFDNFYALFGEEKAPACTGGGD